MKLSILLGILSLISYSRSHHIISTTYDLNKRRQADNDSILLMDTAGNIEKKEVVGLEVFQIFSTTLQNNEDGCLYFLQIEKEIKQVSCSSLKEEKEPIPHGYAFTHFAFDNKRKNFYGIDQEDENQIVVVYRGGGSDVLLNFDDWCAVQIGSNFYDEITGQYVVSCFKGKSDTVYLIVDVEKKKIVKKIKVDIFLDEVKLFNGFLYGFNESNLVTLDMKNPEKGYEVLIDYKIGIPNTPASTLDVDNEKIYASFVNFEKNFFAEFDLKKKTYKKHQVFDTLMNLHYVKEQK